MQRFVASMALHVILEKLLSPLFNAITLSKVLKSPAARPAQASGKSILVTRLDAIGDLVLTTPLLHQLRLQEPNAHIAVVVSPACGPILESSKDIDQVIVYDPKHHLRNSPSRHMGHLEVFSNEHLRTRPWDLAINPRSDDDVYDASFLCYLSGASRRIGFSEKATRTKSIRNFGFDKLFTQVMMPNADQVHERDRGLALLRAVYPKVGVSQPAISILEENLEMARALLGRSQRAGMKDLIVALGLGAGQAKRVWPPDRYADVAKSLISERNARIVLIGSLSETAYSNEIIRLLGQRKIIDCVGKYSLTQTAAILSLCDLFIGNDSGPMHIAAATNAPVVMISCHPKSGAPLHANSPLRFGPICEHSVILQPSQGVKPCIRSCKKSYSHCIKQIEASAVLSAADGVNAQ